MRRVLKGVAAPVVRLGYPGNSKQGPFSDRRCPTLCAPFVKAAAAHLSLPPLQRLLLLFPSLQNTASGSDVRAHLQSLGVTRRGFLPFLLTGDYWGVLVSRLDHNSQHFPRMHTPERH